jgi:hypothetical protein
METQQKISSFTPEQEAMIPAHVDSWVKLFTTEVTDYDRVIKATQALALVCGIGTKESPIDVVVCKSPSEAKRLAAEYDITGDVFSGYGNCTDYGWVSYYEFFKDKCGLEPQENLDIMLEYLKSGVVEAIQTDKIWWVVIAPKYSKLDAENRLHCADGPAMEFHDGDSYYMWHGVRVDEGWIMNPDTAITRDMLINEANLEVRRICSEIVGNERLMRELECISIDKDTDNQGYEMELMRTSKKDPVLERQTDVDEAYHYIWFFRCHCSSTGRQYLIKVDPMPNGKKLKNVWDAKASTFTRDLETFKPVQET